MRTRVQTAAVGRTVLVVDDEDSMRDTVGRMLVRTGYTVFTAADADLAMRIVDEHPAEIDLLLTDVTMRGQSGKELSERVLERYPGTKVLFMSGSSSNDVAMRYGALEEGIDLIRKPFSSDDLMRRVHGAINGST